MREYLYYLTLVRPDALRTGFSEEESEIAIRHFAHLQQLRDEGVVILAGRTDVVDGTFGICVFRAESDDEATAIMNGDPAIDQGLMNGTLYPFKIAVMEGKK
ncbi:MAG TPA: YciI family protein [Thermoanaerobaculia bacterium]|jgi:uncharacterized protein YciI